MACAYPAPELEAPAATPVDASVVAPETAVAPAVSSGVAVALAVPVAAVASVAVAAAELADPVAEEPFTVPLAGPPAELPAAGIPVEPLAVRGVAVLPAAALPAAAVAVAGGETLPGAGKRPPLVPWLWALFVAGLREGVLATAWAAALLSVAAKSLPSVFWAAEYEELVDTAPPACAEVFIGCATLMRGGRGITGIAFIPVERASDVPSGTPRPTISR